jgi:hypothetical protein
MKQVATGYGGTPNLEAIEISYNQILKNNDILRYCYSSIYPKASIKKT